MARKMITNRSSARGETNTLLIAVAEANSAIRDPTSRTHVTVNPNSMKTIEELMNEMETAAREL